MLGAYTVSTVCCLVRYPTIWPIIWVRARSLTVDQISYQDVPEFLPVVQAQGNEEATENEDYSIDCKQRHKEALPDDGKPEQFPERARPLRERLGRGRGQDEGNQAESSEKREKRRDELPNRNLQRPD